MWLNCLGAFLTFTVGMALFAWAVHVSQQEEG